MSRKPETWTNFPRCPSYWDKREVVRAGQHRQLLSYRARYFANMPSISIHRNSSEFDPDPRRSMTKTSERRGHVVTHYDHLLVNRTPSCCNLRCSTENC